MKSETERGKCQKGKQEEDEGEGAQDRQERGTGSVIQNSEQTEDAR